MRIVFDLDGTLADGMHREHFITGETKDWDAFFEACDGDLPIVPTIECLHALHSPHGDAGRHTIEIWSGRGEGEGGSVRRKTHDWLIKCVGVLARDPEMSHGTYFFGDHTIDVRMRGHKDYTGDHDLKKRWLNEARAAGRPPELVFEDRDRVVAMWRAEGIPCFHVAPGAF